MRVFHQTMKFITLIFCLVLASYAADSTPKPVVPAKPAVALKSTPIPDLEMVQLENLALKSQLAAEQEQNTKLQAIVAQQTTEKNKSQQDQLKASQQQIASNLCKAHGLSFELGTCMINFTQSKEHPVPTVDEVVLPQPAPPQPVPTVPGAPAKPAPAPPIAPVPAKPAAAAPPVAH